MHSGKYQNLCVNRRGSTPVVPSGPGYWCGGGSASKIIPLPLAKFCCQPGPNAPLPPPVFQHDVVTGGVLVRLIHGALEHGAVHGPCVPLVAASGDGYAVPTFEAIVVTHANDGR